MAGLFTTVTRALFLSYFFLNSYIAFTQGPAHATEFKKTYQHFESKVTRVLKTKLPHFLNSATVGKHAGNVILGAALLQSVLAFLGLFSGFSVFLTGLVYFLRVCFAHNIVALLSEPHHLKDYEPVLRALALFCGSCAFSAVCTTCALVTPVKQAVDAAKKKK